MSGEERLKPRRSSSFWSRFWYYGVWRALGLLLIVAGVTGVVRGDVDSGVAFVALGVTYAVFIPLNLLSAFRFGYTVGTGDTLAYTVTGEDQNLRPDLHPRDVDVSREWKRL